ncbi:hypothetical protein D805_0205 [Bifidobacterium thermophilum RBL67]|uniref:Uncharacterized protein n=1 Tax=Bifidobacterium thermophilum RBL67 TaxID=1254439 RepID=M4RPK9_9BIFI|nr:hypothetical protein D805_0205 [Bifidobacterium thermophilum RBL67]
MQIDIAAAVDCPQAIHRIIPNMWIIICVIHTVIPTMWITWFSIHILWHPRVAQVSNMKTAYRRRGSKMNDQCCRQTGLSDAVKLIVRHRRLRLSSGQTVGLCMPGRT